VNSLLSGFDTVSNHIGLILFCILFDTLLWLGPQFRLESLLQSFINWTTSNPNLQTQELTELMQANGEVIMSLGERFNMLSFIRTFPIGIPSLMFSRSPIQNPVGSPITWQVPSIPVAFFIWTGLTIIGIGFGALFFKLVAQATLGGKIKFREAIKGWPWYFAQIFLLSIFWFAIIFAASIPIMCIIPVVIVGGINLGAIILIGYIVLLIWFLLPLVFAPHGIFTNRSSMWLSVVQSAQLTRLTLPATILFIISVVVISQGLDLLWNITEDISWITLLSIIGHAFITTSLLAASFVYYRDAQNWVTRIIQKTKFSSLNT